MRTTLHVQRRDPPPPALLAAVGVVVTAAAVVTAWLRWPYGPPLMTVLSLSAVASYLACGLLLWRHRPWSRVGPVLLLAAPAWLVSRYQGPGVSELGLYLANWFSALPLLLLAHLVLSYPTGRLETWPRRLLVVVASALVVPLGFLFNSAYGTRLSLFGQALTFIAAGLALARWAGARGSLRRLLSPLPVVALLFAATAVPNVPYLFPLDAADALQTARLVAAAAQPLVPVAFLLGLLSTRRARGGVADLVVELDGGHVPADVRDLLARALRDPSLQLAYWAPDRQLFVDHQGRELVRPDDDGDRVCVDIEDDGQPLAVVVHDRALAEERELVEAVLAAVRLALVNERLQALVRAQLVDVRASRARLVEAADAARRRLERDLHDGAQQRLLAVGMRLQLASLYAQDQGHDLRVELDQAQAELAQALAELRDLARGLHPTRLRDGGLASALDELARRAPVPVRLECTRARYGELVESTAYFVVAEALTNAAKHARAREVLVEVRDDAGSLRVDVRDDGQGGAHLAPGGGLSGLVDRVGAVGGHLEVRSTPGTGSRVTATLPADHPGPATDRVHAGTGQLDALA